MDSDQENQATTASEDNPSSNNSESSVDTQEDFSKFSVDELKSKLKEAGLPVSGKKAELVERLESSTSEKSGADSEGDSEKDDDDSEKTDEDSEKADAKPVFTSEELSISFKRLLTHTANILCISITGDTLSLVEASVIPRRKDLLLDNSFVSFIEEQIICGASK